ncbi:MAG: nucleotidyl transferase AbiEii/AbiGii toxin family protein [Candidatus Moranbacteria bacterium]|nr:nucleotidyl transferase AbiEii/AbiGii toxin family protein [Candidatus Moranbacteria bacterium]
MTDQELDGYIRELGIAKDHILREEAEMDFLDALSRTKISKKILFYGGTALRLAYGSPRFSEDIDLLCAEEVTFSEFKELINEVVRRYAGRFELRDIKGKRNTLFALIAVRDSRLKHAFSVKVELHRHIPKVSMKTELVLLRSPVSANAPLLLVPTLSELKRMKESALAGRKKARDIFDLWYIAQVSRQAFTVPDDAPQYGKREFSNELRVFLPHAYYPVIEQLYERTHPRH